MRQTFLQVLKRALLAGALSSGVNVAIANMASNFLKAPPSFPPFGLAPILAGCFVGALLAGVFYYFMQSYQRWVYLLTTVIFLFLSFYLPYRIGFSASPRFTGVTLPIQLVLCFMHTLVASTTVLLFRNKPLDTLSA